MKSRLSVRKMFRKVPRSLEGLLYRVVLPDFRHGEYMASYKWKIKHKVLREDLEELLLRFDFEEVEDGKFVRPVNEWKNLELVIATQTSLEVNLHWSGAQTTEIYFDYLLGAGYILGQLSCYLELMKIDDFTFPDEGKDDLIAEDETSVEVDSPLEEGSGSD